MSLFSVLASGSFWLSALALIAVAVLCLALYLKLHVFKRDSRIAGYTPSIISGSIQQLQLHKQSLGFALNEWAKKLGPIFEYWLAVYRVVVVTDADAAQKIFSDRTEFDQATTTTDRFKILSQYGLINLMGADHKRHVYAIGPLFRKHKSTPWVPMIAEKSEEMVRIFKRVYGTSKTVDMLADFKRLTLDIFGVIAYAKEFNCLSEIEGGKGTEVARSTGFVVEAFSSGLLAPLPSSLLRFYFQLWSDYQKHQQVLHKFVAEAIDEWLSTPEAQRSQRMNLLSNMLEVLDQPQGLTREEVFDELVIFIFAGFETTSSFLCWYAAWMTKAPHVQKKLRASVKKILDANGGKLDAEVLASMHYLDCVWKEIFRLTPVAEGTSRTSIQQTEVLGVSFPAGTHFNVNILGLHTSPQYWKHDPSEFYPERFVDVTLIPEEKDTPDVGIDRDHHPCAFLPFGAGHRGCFGQELARIETKAIMAVLSRHISFSAGEGFDMSPIAKITAMPRSTAVKLDFSEPEL